MILDSNIKEFILNNYNQIAIFSKYLNIPYSEIEKSINDNTNIINTNRGDTSPSFKFYYKDNKLIMWDFGSSLYRGDIFDAVGISMNLNSNKYFINICNEILKNNKNEIIEIENQSNKVGYFTYNVRQFNKYDINYWLQANISKSYLACRGVYPVNTLFYNEYNRSNIIYSTIETDPIYVYQLGIFDKTEVFKLYRPNAENPLDKFKSNRNLLLEGINELYESEILIITKSRKDKLTIECNLHNGDISKSIYKLIKKLNIPPFVMYPFMKGSYNDTYKIKSKYCVTNIFSEATLLNTELVEYLYTKHKRIIINYDFDMTGVLNAYFYTKLYNFEAKFIGRDANIILNRIDDKLIKLITNKFDKFDMLFNIDDFINFVNTHSGNYIDKDWFDLFTNNKESAKKLINDLFT